LSQLFGMAATAMAVHNGRVALVGYRLNRLATDGTTGGLPLEGPSTSFGSMLPRSAALSPDGKTLYITGFNRDGWRPNWRLVWIQGVARIDFEKGKKMEPFVGVLSADPKQGGEGNGQFRSPTSVAVDPQGRVYVADRYNDRVQIFEPSGKHLKNLPIPDGHESLPAEVVINPRNGDIYVFSWYLDCYVFRKGGQRKRVACLYHFGPFDKPELKGKYLLPIPDQSRRGRYGGDQLQGREFRATIDPWADDKDGVNIWIIRDNKDPIRVYRINQKKGTLESVKNFTGAGLWYGYGNTPMTVRPDTGELYVSSETSATVVQPDTGKARGVRLPMGIMPNGLYFDMQGHAYLRNSRTVGRFAIAGNDQWREVPFDYGEAIGGRIAALQIETGSIHPQPGFSVSMHGHVVVGYIVGAVQFGGRADAREQQQRQQMAAAVKPWMPQIFPGRGGNSLVRVWDKYGKILYEDAVRGIGYVHGAFMDRHNKLYLATEATREGYFDTMSGSFIKFEPNARILSTKATVPLRPGNRPQRPVDTHRGFGHQGASWWEGAEWFYGGLGFGGKNNSTCHCPNFSAAFDYFARSFVPETRHYSVALLDSAGNLIMRIGQYGSVDDGIPLIADGPPVPNRRKLGGDEVALFMPKFLATHTDRRLFIADPGNQRIVSVKIDYHASETVALKDVK
jgi:DNA-binding beta-propeller fold protein YncE